jgi:DNA (cytosine-5)-methyltransferase 1
VEPYIVSRMGAGTERAHSIDEPMPTATCRGAGYLVKPFLVPVAHGGGDERACSIEEPLKTVCGNRGDQALLEPFIVPVGFGEREGQAPRCHSVDAPLPTVVGNVKHAVIEPHLLPQQSGGALRPVSEPAPTIATAGAIAIVEPFLVSYYGTGGAKSVADPLDTVTTKDRFGLVMPEVMIDGQAYRVRLRWRMLQPHELAAAHSFPKGYQFSGTKTDAVKQVGNSVPSKLARALVRAALTGRQA